VAVVTQDICLSVADWIELFADGQWLQCCLDGEVASGPTLCACVVGMGEADDETL
jgi:hypothetical protein